MKNLTYTFLILMVFSIRPALTQDLSQPVAYMNAISENHRDITKDFFSYTSAVAHSKSGRKIESRRAKLMQTVKDATRKVKSIKPFGTDRSLRDSTARYLELTYIILNEDYGKIINLEDVAEQSYDAMEAYLLAQDLAHDKLKLAHENLEKVQEDFAARNKVQMVAGDKDELYIKMEKAGKVNVYHREVYLVFFKSHKQEMYLLDAIKEQNINAIEQNRNALLKNAEDGIEKIRLLSAFNGDYALGAACRKMLEFHKEECGKIQLITGFYLKNEEFIKAKKIFDAKKTADRSQEDVNHYNKMIGDINKASQDFNELNNNLYSNRNKLLDNWNTSSQKFLSKHTPR